MNDKSLQLESLEPDAEVNPPDSEEANPPKDDGLQTSADSNLQTVHGIIKSVIFCNQTNGFIILRLFSKDRTLIASGNFFDMPVVDSKIKLKGRYVYHKKYGYQFNFDEYELFLATTKTAIINYLSSSIFKGIGKFLAEEIYDKFKEDTLNIIDNEPERIREVKGIGDVKINFVIEGIKSSAGLRRAIMFFKPYQFSDYQIKAVYNKFKEKSIQLAKENPYIFTEIKGIGFKKADIMANKLGISKHDPNRIKEAVKYLINELCMNNGNTFVYFSDIKNNISEMIEDFGNNDETGINGEINISADADTEQVNFNFKDLKKFIIELSTAKQIIIDPPFLFSDFNNENADVCQTDFNMRKIYLPVYYYSELRIAKELQRLLQYAQYNTESNNSGGSTDCNTANKDADAAPNNFSEFLTEEQKNAVINAIKYKISIISGGPGTGKSTIIKEICKIHNEKNIALTSLSGKAAQRLEDIIFAADEKHSGKHNGSDAEDGTTYSISTIHRLLKATINRETNESYFTYNENNKLPFDLVVIDEMSMVDAVIFSQLLKALKDEAKLVLVGDVNQLPSVNPGDLLRDLINFNEKIIPSVFLTKVFRQNEGGLINLNAHNLLNNKKFITYAANNLNEFKHEDIKVKINEGIKVPDSKKTKKHNEFMIKYKKIYDEKETGKVYVLEDFIDFIKKVKNKRIEKQKTNKDVYINNHDNNYNHHVDFNDIQVLTPMRKGELGYFKLNTILQEIFNPIENINSSEDTFICNGVQFRVNDRVIQTKNNYDLDVFNGDTGVIISIDHIGKTMTVNFSKPVAYDFLDVYSNLSLAYALSIHKSQGSEFDNVIIIFHQTHYMMLKKNLLYTAITRGKKNVVIFGTFKAFSIAMHSKIEERNSGLKDRLIEIFQ